MKVRIKESQRSGMKGTRDFNGVRVYDGKGGKSDMAEAFEKRVMLAIMRSYGSYRGAHEGV